MDEKLFVANPLLSKRTVSFRDESSKEVNEGVEMHSLPGKFEEESVNAADDHMRFTMGVGDDIERDSIFHTLKMQDRKRHSFSTKDSSFPKRSLFSRLNGNNELSVSCICVVYPRRCHMPKSASEPQWQHVTAHSQNNKQQTDEKQHSIDGAVLILITGKNGDIVVIDAESAQVLYRLSGGHTTASQISCLFVYEEESNGVILVSGGHDNNIAVWDLHKRRILHKLVSAHLFCISAVTVAAVPMHVLKIQELNKIRSAGYNINQENKQRLVVISASFDETAVFWDLLSGIELFRLGTLPKLDYGSTAISFFQLKHDGPNSKPLLLSTCFNKSIYLWDLTVRNVLIEFPRFQNGISSCLAVYHSPLLRNKHDDDPLVGPPLSVVDPGTGVAAGTTTSDYVLAITGSTDKSVAIWLADMGRLIMTLSNVHIEAITSVALHRNAPPVVRNDNDLSLIGNTNVVSSVLTFAISNFVRNTYINFKRSNERITHHRDDDNHNNNTHLSQRHKSTKQILSVAANKDRSEFQQEEDRLARIFQELSGLLAFTASADRSIAIWDVSTGLPVRVLRGVDYTAVNSMQVFVWENPLLFGSGGGANTSIGDGSSVYRTACADLSVIVGHQSGQVVLWDLGASESVNLGSPHAHLVTCIASLSPMSSNQHPKLGITPDIAAKKKEGGTDGGILLSCSSDGLQLWDSVTGKPTKKINLSDCDGSDGDGAVASMIAVRVSKEEYNALIMNSRKTIFQAQQQQPQLDATTGGESSRTIPVVVIAGKESISVWCLETERKLVTFAETVASATISLWTSHVIKLKAHPEPWFGSNNLKVIASSKSSSSVFIFDLVSGSLLKTIDFEDYGNSGHNSGDTGGVGIHSVLLAEIPKEPFSNSSHDTATEAAAVPLLRRGNRKISAQDIADAVHTEFSYLLVVVRLDSCVFVFNLAEERVDRILSPCHDDVVNCSVLVSVGLTIQHESAAGVLRSTEDGPQSTAFLLLTGGKDAVVAIRDVVTGATLRYLDGQHTHGISAIVAIGPAQFPNNLVGKSTAFRKSSKRFSVRDEKPLSQKSRKSETEGASSHLSTSVGRQETVVQSTFVLTSDANLYIVVWNLLNGLAIRKIALWHNCGVKCMVAFDSSLVGKGPFIFYVNDDNAVCIQDPLFGIANSDNISCPSAGAILAMYTADATDIKLSSDNYPWERLSELREAYGGLFLIENLNLFVLAIRDKQRSFIELFESELSLIIHRLPDIELGKCAVRFAIDNHDLLTLKILLRCWLVALHKNCTGEYDQVFGHASHFFRMDILIHLSIEYPQEFYNFICELKLVSAAPYVIKPHMRAVLDDASRRLLICCQTFNTADLWTQVLNDSANADGFDVTALYMPLKNCCCIQLLNTLVMVSKRLDHANIFGSPLGEMMLVYAWRTHGQNVHRAATSYYIFMLLAFSLALYTYPFAVGQNAHYLLAFADVLQVAVIVLNVRELNIMVSRIRRSRSFVAGSLLIDAKTLHWWTVIKHFFEDSWWNVVHLISIFSCIIGLSARLALRNTSTLSAGANSIAAFSLWFRSLYFLTPFPDTGPLVTKLLTVAGRIRVFLVIMFLIGIGYSQVYWIQHQQSHPKLHADTMVDAVFHAFIATLGQFTTSSAGVANPFINSLMEMGFLLFNVVLMLNMLIALMTDIYSSISPNKWRLDQAKIILDEYGDAGHRADDIPPFLHVLVYTADLATATADTAKSYSATGGGGGGGVSSSSKTIASTAETKQR